MTYNDLQPICRSIPVNDAGDVSTQASAILKGLTGEVAEFQINTGETPVLPTPTVSVGYNQITNQSNPNLGAYWDIRRKTTLNGVVYSDTSAISNEVINVTSDMDNKLLEVQFYQSGFTSSQKVSTNVHYIAPPSASQSVTIDVSGLDTTKFSAASSDRDRIITIQAGYSLRQDVYLGGSKLFDAQSEVVIAVWHHDTRTWDVITPGVLYYIRNSNYTSWDPVFLTVKFYYGKNSSATGTVGTVISSPSDNFANTLGWEGSYSMPTTYLIGNVGFVSNNEVKSRAISIVYAKSNNYRNLTYTGSTSDPVPDSEHPYGIALTFAH